MKLRGLAPKHMSDFSLQYDKECKSENEYPSKSTVGLLTLSYAIPRPNNCHLIQNKLWFFYFFFHYLPESFCVPVDFPVDILIENLVPGLQLHKILHLILVRFYTCCEGQNALAGSAECSPTGGMAREESSEIQQRQVQDPAPGEE